jgi:hypothetical protein
MGKCRELGVVLRLIDRGMFTSAIAAYRTSPREFSPKTLRKWLRDDPPTRRTHFAKLLKVDP